MAPRRGVSTSNTLSPYDAAYASSTPASPANLHFPQSRSNSPSGLTQFLSKPTKWFVRKPSDARSISATNEPRTSTSSVRRPKISRPTDPRPILTHFHAEPHAHDASKSVADLTLHPKKSLDFINASSPSRPSVNTGGALGDLRTISRKAWSKSADDLASFCSPSQGGVDAAFQNRIQEYRNRSSSSATLHPTSPSDNATPSPSTPTHHPFPTVISTIPLSSSPSSDKVVPVEPAISISISSPTAESFTTAEEPHTPTARSHSFTPRLPTKLSASKLGLSANSPKRKESGDSIRDKDATGNNNSARGVFPFSLPYQSNKHAAPGPLPASGSAGDNHAPPPTLLVPPAVPNGTEDEPVVDSRRTSQIVYNSGFLNRMADAPPLVNAYSQPYGAAANVTLSKGWKPFKAELKGSKLYFYKPPSDRNAAVKELFPTGIVPPNLEEDAAVVETEASEEGCKPSRARDDGTIGRKKRAYWGRRTHPQLVVGECGVEKGTFEALVHEAVFATTFVLPQNPDDAKGPSQSGDDPRRPGWRDFSSAMLLCMPLHVDRSKFENEFTRCCTNLVNGASEDAKEIERTRVTWMARHYLRYHGTPKDGSVWDDFVSSIIPHFVSEHIFPVDELPASIPQSGPSTQALYSSSSNLPLPNSSSDSSGSGIFPPRPQEEERVKSLIQALGTTNTALNTSPSKALTAKQQRPQIPFSEVDERSKAWAMLARNGFTREALSLFDPQLIAFSLQMYHRRAFENMRNNIGHASFILGTVGASSAESDASTESQSSPSDRLFGSDDSPHWLTKLLIMQILGSDSANCANGGGASSERSPQTSRTHSRSEVISIWARVGELCRAAGDECSWMAIRHALCSRPVARLIKAWKRADRQSLIAVESWVYPENDGRSAAVGVPLVTAWGGDAKEQIRRQLDHATNEAEEHWLVPPQMKARELFEDLATRFAQCSHSSVEGTALSQDAEKLVSLWEKYSQGNGVQNAFSLKFQRIDQFMSLSLAAEPRRKVPLLFVEPLPTVSLIERGQVWRGRLESGPAKFSMEELQQIRSLDISLRFSGRVGGESSSSRDRLFNVGEVDLRGTAIPVYDGELVVVARPDKDPSIASRPASRAPSRPPSSVVDGTGNEKTMTRSPSIRVKPGSTQGLERKSSVARRNSLPSISTRANAVVTEVSSERPIRVFVQAGTLDRLVNVLIHGLQGVSVAVADDNGETSLRDGNTRDLVVDHTDFARVWWNVFRSFVTPIVFFELLRKRFLCSRPSSSPSSGGPVQVIQYRSEILGSMKEWITTGCGAQDCLDDASLYEMVRTFLELPLDRSELDTLPSSEDSEILQAWEGLEAMKQNTLTAFTSHTLRPPALVAANPRPTAAFGLARSFGGQPPDIDHVTAEDFVDNLNTMGSAALSNVTEEDLFTTADLLEVQSADRTGWFSSRDPGVTEEVDIQTMYSHLMDVEPSTMISELSQDSIYRLLPPGIRSCIRAYNIIRKWLICKLVAPKLGRVTFVRGRFREEVDRKDFERLYNIEKEVSSLHLDHRGIKDEAQREALQAQVGGTTSAKKVARPFQRLVAVQQEKNKRDKYLHDRLSKDKKQEQLRNERRDDYLNKAMRPRKPMTQAQKQHRIKKSYSSAFFQLMRPISSAFTDSTNVFGTKKSPSELDFLPSGKPSLVLSVVDAKVTQVVNNERSYVFQLDTEDGGHYLLQAISKPEMAKWIDQISKVSKTAAKRRLTYLGNSPKPQLSDHIHDHVVAPSASRHPTAVFGVELEFLLQREAGGGEVEPGSVPSVISRCLYEVESRGLSEVGIYRIAGAASEVNGLRDAFNNGEMPITDSNDVHAICDLIKSWFRLLPEPVFPSSAYFGVIEAMKIENLNARLSCIRHIVHELPQANFDLLKRVAEHLDKVTDYEEHNHMTAEALAIVFSPNLLRAPKNDFALILANMGYTHILVKALITHFHVIFDEDHEAENDAEEDEMEEPILEEDEEDEEE
ncbi:hypothetical protein ID866_4315 [Astraeus odoratus]|nr:hypothetical protein ID866_4315 [Astraeus odoratus]